MSSCLSTVIITAGQRSILQNLDHLPQCIFNNIKVCNKLIILHLKQTMSCDKSLVKKSKLLITIDNNKQLTDIVKHFLLSV